MCLCRVRVLGKLTERLELALPEAPGEALVEVSLPRHIVAFPEMILNVYNAVQFSGSMGDCGITRTPTVELTTVCLSSVPSDMKWRE